VAFEPFQPKGDAVRPRKKELWTAITYPQDFSDKGAGLGPQTILRLQRIIQVSQTNKILFRNDAGLARR
jgi:hypothetical protein